MKALIIYGTRYGSTAEISEEMGKTLRELGVEVDVVNAKKGRVENPGGYDLYIVGSGIKMGKWTREPQRFLKNNRERLTNRPVALFVSCGSVEKPEECEKARSEYLDDIEGKYPDLRVIAKGMFGGRYDPNGGFMMRMAMKGKQDEMEKEGREFDPDSVYDFRDWDAIRAWAAGLIDLAS